MGTWRRTGRVPCPPVRVVESICSNGSHAVRSIPARMRCRAGSGQDGDSRAGFGHCGHCRADSGHKRGLRVTFHHFEHSERPNVARESLQCLNLARRRFQCPDIARQREACPDSARRRQAFAGYRARTQKVPLALLGERQKKTVGEGCNETGARYINPQESR